MRNFSPTTSPASCWVQSPSDSGTCGRLCSFLLMTAARSRRRLLLAGSFVVLAAIATHIYLEANAANQLVACQQEYKSVQAGIDGLMANNSLSVVQPTGPKGTNDMRSPVLVVSRLVV